MSVERLFQLADALTEKPRAWVEAGPADGRALALVLEWAALHRDELREDWHRARAGETLNEIEPLE
jgi:hypothetical protein